MKVYVVTIDMSYDYDNKIFVKVFKDRKKAEKYMLEHFQYEINDISYDTIEYGEFVCSAYDDSYFVKNHCEIKVLEKEVEE